jgi:uncharacterized protein (DUF362 family)
MLKNFPVFQSKATDDLGKAVNEVVNKLGGFAKHIKKGERILVKPNVNTADDPPASTDIDFLRAVVELIHKETPSEVIVADSSTFSHSSNKDIQKKGFFELEKEFPNTKVMTFDDGEWIKKEVPGGKYLKSVRIPELLEQVDKIIFLPCLKTHSYAQFTGALKLGVGLMIPRERLILHAGHLQEKIAELNLLFKPDLIIMDGRKCFINQGPSNGEMREPNTILASESRVAIDIEGIKIIQGYERNDLAGIEAEELTQIKLAIELGIDS